MVYFGHVQYRSNSGGIHLGKLLRLLIYLGYGGQTEKALPENLLSSPHCTDEDMERSRGRNLAKVTWPTSPCHPLASPAQGPNIIPADIIFIVKEKLHPRFRRENDNLFFVNPIPLGKVSGQSAGAAGRGSA